MELIHLRICVEESMTDCFVVFTVVTVSVNTANMSKSELCVGDEIEVNETNAVYWKHTICTRRLGWIAT